MSAGSGRRARRSLLLSGAVVAAGIASVGLCVQLLGGGPSFGVALALTLAPLVLAVAAGFSARACRASTVVLVAASDFAGLAVAVDLGLILMLLVFGRTPVGIQHDLVNPALLGMLLVATLAWPLGRRAGRSTRAALSGIRRSPDELLADFADRAVRGTSVQELLRQLAESMRRDWRLSSVQIWSATDADPAAGELFRTVVVPAPLDPVPDPPPLQAHELEMLARAGVAGRGWLRLWLLRLLPPPDEEESQLRFAPAVHAGRVLALIVVERPADAAAFSASDERALAEVVRRLAIVLRNRALDEALQSTLADLRRSNSELQASRARLVAAADAERSSASSATCTTVLSSTSSRWPSGCASCATACPTPAPTWSCSTSSTGVSASRCRRCATSPTASTRRCCATRGSPRPCARRPSGARCTSRCAPTGWAASPSRWRRPCTSAASRRCRTPPSTPPAPR